MSDKPNELRTVLNVLRELVAAIEEQDDVLDPTSRLVKALRDAKSWLTD